MALAGVMACARAVPGVQSWTGHAHGMGHAHVVDVLCLPGIR